MSDKGWGHPVAIAIMVFDDMADGQLEHVIHKARLTLEAKNWPLRRAFIIRVDGLLEEKEASQLLAFIEGTEDPGLRQAAVDSIARAEARRMAESKTKEPN